MRVTWLPKTGSLVVFPTLVVGALCGEGGGAFAFGKLRFARDKLPSAATKRCAQVHPLRSTPSVPMMQAADLRNLHNPPSHRWLHGARKGSILTQRQVSARLAGYQQHRHADAAGPRNNGE